MKSIEIRTQGIFIDQAGSETGLWFYPEPVKNSAQCPEPSVQTAASGIQSLESSIQRQESRNSGMLLNNDFLKDVTRWPYSGWVTSTNVGINLQNFLTFSFNPFETNTNLLNLN